MDIILHNFIADMPGPNFLGFYALVIVVTFILCWILKRMADSSQFLPQLLVPEQPNPYELAYLRGGEKEVARVVVFNLMRRKFLEIVSDSAGNWQLLQQVVANIPLATQLNWMERNVFDWFVQPRTQVEVASSALPDLLETFCVGYQRHLQEEQLLTLPDMKSTARRIFLLGMLVIAGLGGYKLCVAVVKGHSNVIFLILMGIVALIILIFVCKTSRLTARGKAYLERLQRAFGSLRAKVTKGAVPDSDMGYLLTVGLFGTVMLEDTPYAGFHRMVQPPTTSSGGDFGGGGGGGDGGGCGGGGGGGGGCGGCGG